MSQNISDFLLKINSWNQNTLVILDIDSTLVLTHKRNQSILEQFSKEAKEDFPELCSKLQQIDCRPMEYGYQQALERTGLSLEDSDLNLLKDYWRQKFFSNDYLHYDILHLGALEFVLLLEERQIPFVYLTGRHKPTMWEGTLKVLQNFGFPIKENILHLKPEPKYIDEIFKSEKIAELKNGYETVVLIDNEPKVLNQIAKDHPDVDLIFVDTCHSPNVTAPESALKIKDFSSILNR